MSRLIVKNLPKDIKKEKLNELFGSHGQITDLRMCKTKSGDFRRFAFVGFRTEDEAGRALAFFNKSYINTSKLQVEIAKNIGDETVARPWSKYSTTSSAYSKRLKESKDRKQRIRELQTNNNEKSTDQNRENVSDEDEKMKNIQQENVEEEKTDEGFSEFLIAHKKKSTKKTWANEITSVEEDSSNKRSKNKAKNNGKNSKKHEQEMTRKGKAGSSSNVIKKINKENSSQKTEPSVADEERDGTQVTQEKFGGSDLDWLKSKVTKDEIEDDGNHDNLKSMEDENSEETSSSESENSEESNAKNLATMSSTNKWSMTVKMRGLPFKCTEKEIIDFFSPLIVNDIRIVLNDDNKPKGIAFVDFDAEDCVIEAMKRNKKKIKGRYIELFRVEKEKSLAETVTNDGDYFPWKNKKPEEDEEEEPIAESGRLFIRNLSYTCTEDEIKELFEKFGPVAEVHLPIDKTSKRITGIGFVTYMIPEHAVKAMNELDGMVFQGRLLHLISARSKKNEEDDRFPKGLSSYQKEKHEKIKSLSSSGHNWNTLFLGQNAVVDALAERMNTQKSEILDSAHSGSLAVRMALGETQIVAETREFLTSNGVKLDAFGQTKGKKSSTVILVKNLPHGTTTEELRETFGKFGDFNRLLLPPSGISAIIEFLQPTEARMAFRSLAYTKFKHVPLYLEWAPIDVFSGEKITEVENEEDLSNDAEMEQGEEEDVFGDQGRVLFVKNLNFNTTEEALKATFEKCGKLSSVTIARKKDPKKPNKFLSMGYGFVEYLKRQEANEALKVLQHTMLDGHQLELKKSHRKSHDVMTAKGKANSKKQTSGRILVRNIPFEATKKEVQQLFSAFGDIKTVRLPKKLTGTHRGFAFVEFLTKQDAKRAFKALCQSTHLYGRRLVLEWADAEETIDSIRQRTALHFHAEPATKKRKQEIIDMLDNAQPDKSL